MGDWIDGRREAKNDADYAALVHKRNRGELTGDMAQDRGQLYRGPAAFSGHQTAQSMAQSQGGSAAQGQAMGGLSQAANTGWTGIDAMSNQRLMTQANAGANQQARGAQQQAGAQGQLQGGAALRGALQAQQTGADQAANAGQAIAMQGADRRAAAGQGQMALGGQMNQESLQRAGANDAFNIWAKGMADQETAALRGNELGEREQEIAANNAMFERIQKAGQTMTNAFKAGGS